SHAGALKTPNCVPNYLSSMNYLYQTRGLTDAANSEHVDYSRGKLNTVLMEGSLSEPFPLGFDAQNQPVAPDYKIRYFGPLAPSDPSTAAAQLHCDGTPLTGDSGMLRLENSFPNFIDWNNDGVQTGVTLALDVNYDGTTGVLLSDYNDWGNLNLQQVGA